MEYLKLMLGIGLVLVFAWLLVKNSKRSGLMNALMQLDTIIGIIAGIYLVVTSVSSLIFS